MNDRTTFTVCALAFLSIHASAQCDGIFFSEYVEGGPGVMALEIYNPTPALVDLSAYYIRGFPNGSSVTVNFLQLSGTLATGAVMVVQHDELVAAGIPFDGNDAMTLERITSTPPYDVVVDVIGQPGVDPGTGWTADALANYTSANNAVPWTRDHTLRRKPTVQHGLSAVPSPFNVTLEWDSLPMNTVSGLGTHTCYCQSTGFEETIAEGTPDPTLVVLSDARIEVRSEEPLHAITIFDASGRAMSLGSTTVPSTTTELDLSGAASGLYVLRGLLENGRSVSRRFLLP